MSIKENEFKLEELGGRYQILMRESNPIVDELYHL